MLIDATDLVEMSVKSGGHVYLSRGTNAPRGGHNSSSSCDE